MAKTKKKAVKPVEAEVEEVEELEEDLELEELDDDVDAEEEAPKKKKAKAKSQEVVFGASDLAALLTEKTGQNINARGLRVLLRKMARDGRLTREVTPGNRTRYNWTGPKDPEVLAIIKAVTDGEIEEGKKEALAKLKEKKASNTAAAKTSKKSKKAKAPEPEEVEDDDFEEDEED